MDAALPGWTLWPAWLLAAGVLARAFPSLRRLAATLDDDGRRVLVVFSDGGVEPGVEPARRGRLAEGSKVSPGSAPHGARFLETPRRDGRGGENQAGCLR